MCRWNENPLTLFGASSTDYHPCKGWGYSDIFYIHRLGSKFSFSVFFLVFNKNNFFGGVGDFCGYFLRVTSKFDYFYSYLFKSATVICIL